VPGKDVPGIDPQGFVVPRYCFFEAALLSQAIGEIELRLGIGPVRFLGAWGYFTYAGRWEYRCYCTALEKPMRSPRV
jgi:hypothetical protein